MKESLILTGILILVCGCLGSQEDTGIQNQDTGMMPGEGRGNWSAGYLGPGRFDSDGDGVLSEEEKARMDEMRNQTGMGRPPRMQDP
jgi:hypothetical protein